MIISKAAIYKRNTLQEIIESISIEAAAQLLAEGPAKGLKINVAAFMEDGRHLDGVYEEMGPTIYAQPFAVHTEPSMSEEEIAERISELHCIVTQYNANINYLSSQE